MMSWTGRRRSTWNVWTVYLHGYLGQLQVGGQMIQLLNHRGYPVPSPACLQQIGDAFRRRVVSFAQANHIPVVPLKGADRNIEVMRPYLEAAAASGRSQVAAIGVAQEAQRVFPGCKRDTDPARCPAFSFDKKDRRVTVYYFYLWDAGFGPAPCAPSPASPVSSPVITGSQTHREPATSLTAISLDPTNYR
jgi:hypothetical protein